MTFQFRPAKDFHDRHGCFVALTGGTNSGKTFSALRLARGIAGPSGKIAVLDTEGGRTLHLKEQFDFDIMMMAPLFRPAMFAEAAESAEQAGYACLVIDSFSMEWAGIGGVLDWHTEELDATVARAKARSNDTRTEYAIREAGKMAAWIKPQMAHKAMVYSFLQRRMPIIFSIRGEQSVTPAERGGKPVTVFKSICSPKFPFEMTVAFRLQSEAKGIIDLSDPKSWKMEGAHRAIFRDQDQISERHGAALDAWARGIETAPAVGVGRELLHTHNDPSAHRTGEALPAPPPFAPPRQTAAEWLDALDAALMGAMTHDAMADVMAERRVPRALARATGDTKARLEAIIAAANVRVRDHMASEPDPEFRSDGHDPPLDEALGTMPDFPGDRP